MDYQHRDVVVTGGTGALGTALVGALLKVGLIELPLPVITDSS
jgi:nucleoside-diphosphate-sugar epimerase